MYIQYVGFNLASDSRIYKFHVIDAPHEAREFTVDVQSEALRLPPMKVQDGPGICFTRLKQELDQETPESRAQAYLHIGARDVQEYSAKQYPPKASKKSGPAAKP
jgi:hypothetical protein